MNNFMPKWLLNSLGVLLLILIALLVVGKVKNLNDIFRKKVLPENTISVSAEGRVKAVPDLATVNLGVLTQGKTPVEVQEENTKKVNKIIDYIKQQGVSKDDISTSQFNIYPQYDYKEGRSEIVGYQLNQTITFKIRGIDKSNEQLGKILEGGVAQGANEISGVFLSFDDPDNLRQNARKQAIEKAKEKAQELAQVAGLKLGRVVSIAETTATGLPKPYYSGDFGGIGGAGGLGLEKAAAPNIEPGSQDVIETMTVVFEVK